MTKDELKIEKYWEIKFTRENDYSHFRKEELIDSIDEILSDAVKIRLRSDVPVGSYLSGGLDSSGITSIIKNNFNNKLNTFGIRFEDQKFDESIFQSEMVNFLNVDHSDIIIKDEDIGNNFELSLWHIRKTCSSHSTCSTSSPFFPCTSERLQSSSHRRRF